MNSVLTVSAKFVNILQRNTPATAETMNPNFGIHQINSLCYPYNLIALLLQRGAARISEVLSIKPHQINMDGSVTILAAKKGRAYRVYVPEFTQQLLKAKTLGLPLFRGYNYWSVYRMFLKNGISVKLSDHKNLAVTHQFRHEAADQVRNSEFSDEVVSDILHHKSLSSQKSYGNKTKSRG
jgi:integrase